MTNHSTLRSKVLILLIFAFFIIFSSALALSPSAFIVQVILFSITTLLLIKKKCEIIKIYTIIFIVSICMVFLVYAANLIYYGAPYYIGGSDDLRFEEKGYAVAEANIYNPEKILGTTLDSYDNTAFFAVYMAILIKISDFFGGYSTFIPRIANIYILIWILIIFEYFLSKYSNFSHEKVKHVILITGLTPNVLYINSYIFRDTLNLFQIFLIMYVFERLIDVRKFTKKLFYAVALLFLFYITFYTRKSSLVFAIALLSIILCERFGKKLVFALAIIVSSLFMQKILTIVNFEYFSTYYTNYIITRAGEGLSSEIFKQPLLPFGIFLRGIYALITPFPNFFGLFKDTSAILHDIIMLLVYCGVVIQIIFIPFIIKRLSKFDWLTFSFAIIFLGVIATTFNFRHVILYYPFLVALAVDGYIESNYKARKIIIFLSTFIAICFGFIYMILKIL